MSKGWHLGSAVVVGVDGNPPSTQAVKWAAHDAALRRLPLVVVHAFAPAGRAPNSEAKAQDRDDAWALGRRGVAAANQAEPGVHAVPYAAQGTVPEVMYVAAERPELFVVGCRGRGGMASLLLGSTGIELAGHGPRPVVVVRSRAPSVGQARELAGHVVVGIDHAHRSAPILNLAFDEAARRGCPVAVVHVGVSLIGNAWHDVKLGAEHDADPGWALLEAAVAPMRRRWAQVPVRLAMHHPPAAAGLFSACAGAELLVVGTVGFGRIGGAWHCSVSRAAVTGSPCPVAVVPTTAGPATDRPYTPRRQVDVGVSHPQDGRAGDPVGGEVGERAVGPVERVGAGRHLQRHA